ncbi:MAG: DUF5132 domain-containing protein [Verrucomicrobia bacterium]|nr:DUF5132 domain-containing protein [Verrucomicrobiota bacterium]
MPRDDTNSGKTAEHKNMEQREIHSASSRRQFPRSPVSGPLLTAGALIGVATLVAPELFVGMAVGPGIAMASNWLPDLVGGTMRPLLKTAVKAGYGAATMAREMISEASESVSDIVAEARAESSSPQ